MQGHSLHASKAPNTRLYGVRDARMGCQASLSSQLAAGQKSASVNASAGVSSIPSYSYSPSLWCQTTLAVHVYIHSPKDSHGSPSSLGCKNMNSLALDVNEVALERLSEGGALRGSITVTNATQVLQSIVINEPFSEGVAFCIEDGLQDALAGIAATTLILGPEQRVRIDVKGARDDCRDIMVLACALGSIRVPVRGPRAARDSDDFAAQANAFESAVKRRLLDAEDGEGGLDGEGDVSMPQEGVGANDTERDRGEERPVAAQDDARTSPAPAAVSGEEPGVSQRSERPNSTPAESHDAPLPMPVIKASFRGLPGSGTARVAQRTIVTEGGEERVAAPATLSLRAEARLPPRAAQDAGPLSPVRAKYDHSQGETLFEINGEWYNARGERVGMDAARSRGGMGNRGSGVDGGLELTWRAPTGMGQIEGPLGMGADQLRSEPDGGRSPTRASSKSSRGVLRSRVGSTAQSTGVAKTSRRDMEANWEALGGL